MGEPIALQNQKHFVLVHGLCHGAWCWYKLKPLLESSGHKVTTLDMTASGINMKGIKEISTLQEYTKPLLEFLGSLESDEKVILVGHSFGGFSLAVATEIYPHKVSIAVYLTAFMPDTDHKPSYVLDQYFERTPSESLLDTQFAPYSESQTHLTTMYFGLKFLAFKVYQLSSSEDLELAKALIRPGSLFIHDLSTSNIINFSNEGYGSVKRVYIVCNEDLCIPKEFQLWMIENSPVEQVFEIKDVDHMPMLCKPQQLCDFLLEININ
ncbi:hypothetical protein ACFE04_021941 [Oxalis oulophora]